MIRPDHDRVVVAASDVVGENAKHDRTENERSPDDERPGETPRDEEAPEHGGAETEKQRL